MRRRLYLQIYLTIVASLVLVVVLSALIWSAFGRDGFGREARHIARGLARLALPPAEAGTNFQARAVERLGQELGIDISLFGPRGELLGAHGRPRPRPPADAPRGRWHRGKGTHVWVLGLPDGRWLVADMRRRRLGHPLVNLLLLIGSVAAGVGIGAYPLVRRLTRRLERLQDGVERIGAGDLGARIEISGRDEIARVAASFNEAAGKIERLVDAHRMLLANASHELRTPLSRIRLGVEMLRGADDPARRAALEEDIAELDSLIDEILLMSRLDSGAAGTGTEPVDLVALVAEEAARTPGTGFAAPGAGDAPPKIAADPKLLRRLFRNLIDNAHRHGGPPVEVALSHAGGVAIAVVRDGGDGIAETERDAVFRPFYRVPGRQNVQGYGLGLALVRQIAELHGGTVAILPGPGSAVEVRLPGTGPGA